jgi:hypothetical protein
MSVSPPKADIAERQLDVRFVARSGLMHRSKHNPIKVVMVRPTSRCLMALALNAHVN